MRKFITLISAAALYALTLLSCSEKENTQPKGDGEDKPTIEKYRIIYHYDDREDSLSYDLAKTLRDKVKQRTGKVVKIYKSNVSPITEEIILGRTTRKESDEFYKSNTDDFSYWIAFKDGKILIGAGGSWALSAAVQRFDSEILAKGFTYKEGLVIKGSVRGKVLFPRTTGSNLRILDQNIWQFDNAGNAASWESVGENCTNAVRVKNFVQLVKAYDPDIWTMQEYSDKMKTLMEPMLKDMNLLPVTQSTNYTPIYYNSATLKLDYQTYAQYGNYTSPSGDKISPGVSKSYTLAVFTHRATNKQFMLVSTHLWWQSESAKKGSNSCREAEVRALDAKIEEIRKTYDVPVFLVGDMNCKLESAAMQILTYKTYQPLCKIATIWGDGSNGWHPADQYKFSREYKSEVDKFAGKTTDDGWKWSSLNGKHDTSDQGRGCIDQFFLYNGGSTKVLYFERVHAYFTIKLADHYPNYADIAL